MTDDRSRHRAIRNLYGEILDNHKLSYRIAVDTDELEGWWKVYEPPLGSDEDELRSGLAEVARAALENYIEENGLDDPERNERLCFRLVMGPGIALVNSAGVIQPTIYVSHE